MIRAVDLRPELDALAAEGLLRVPRQVEPVDATRVRIDGREVVLLCSNDYLGLSHHPSLPAVLADAARTEGLGAGASRLVSGTRTPHLQLEAALADWVGAEAALLFNSGYAANVGALSCLLGRGDVAFSDALNHASVIDGLRLSRASVHLYRHADTGHLDELLAQHRPGARRAWVVTDTVFSMDGDEAPLRTLRALADRHRASLYLDDAHALGTLRDGRGLAHELGVVADALVGTLGKAVGTSGAFVAGSRTVRTFLENRARSYVYSTAQPAALARATLHAVELTREAVEPRKTLAAHVALVRGRLRRQGWSVPEGRSPIIPVVVGDRDRAMRLSAALLERGFFVQGIRPPTVPAGTSRLRVVPTAAHESGQLEGFLAAMESLR